jgi:hypothetical protein
MSDNGSAKGAAQDTGALVADVFGADFANDDSGDDAPPPMRPSRRLPVYSDDDDDNDVPSPVKTKAKRVPRKERDDVGSSAEMSDDDDGGYRAPKRKRGTDVGKAKIAGKRAKTADGDGNRRRRSASGIAGAGRSSAFDGIEDDELVDDRRRGRGENDSDDELPEERGYDDDVEGGVGGGAEDGEDEREQKQLSAFDQALADQKASRRQRKKGADPKDVDDEVEDFLQQMINARNEDVASFERGEPALQKLRLLPKVRLMFVRHEYRESLLEHMMLTVLKLWLEPMGDALPNLEIRQSLLDILGTFRVDSSWVQRLEDSDGLGKVINYLSRRDDIPANRRAAKKLMMAWSRPFYNANADFHDLREDFENNDGIAEKRQDAQKELNKLTAQNQKRLDLLRSSAGREDGEEQVKVMAELPQKTSFLFTKMAESEVDRRVTKNRNVRKASFSGKRGINKRISEMKNAKKNTARGSTVPSINGRN